MSQTTKYLVTVMLLAGCSANGSPSDAEIDKAVRANVDAYNAQMKAMSGGMFGDVGAVVHGVKNLGCKSAIGANGYSCDVEVDATIPMAGRSKSVSELRLVKSTSGWQVVQKH